MCWEEIEEGKGGSRRQLKVCCNNVVRDDGGLDFVVGSRVGDTWLSLGYVIKVKVMSFVNVENKREKI